MEKDKEILKRIIADDFKETEIPSNLNHKVMQHIQYHTNLKQKPLVASWIWYVLAVCFGAIVWLTFKYDLHVELAFIEESWVTLMKEFVMSGMVPVIGIGIILFFVCVDIFIRKLQVRK